MKKLKIKLLAVMISALLCSQIWAQGRESTGDWFYITMDDSKKNFQSLKIATENGKHKIIDGLIPNSNSTGYTAFFIGDNGSYYIYDKKNNKNSWFVADNEEIDAINKLYSFVNNKNSTVTSEEKDIYIKNTGYANVEKSLINIKKSEYNPVRTRNNGFNELYIYDELKGVFGFALYPEDSDMVQIICFRDTKSIAEISSAALGTNDNPYNDFFTWLKKSPENKISDKNNDEYKRIAQLIYDSLKNKTEERCYNLYTTNNFLFRKYLQLAQQESRNVFFPEKGIHYKTIEKEEAKKIVDEADKYINTVITFKSIFTTKNIIVPMPYKAGKKNTPEDLKNIKKHKDLLNIGCDDKSFVAEIIKKAIERDDLYNSFNDLSKYSLLISDINDVQVGDLLFFEYDPMQQGFSNIQGQKCGIIVETPKVNEEFGTYQKLSLGNLSVIWMNEDRGAEKKNLSEIWNVGEDFEVPLYTEIRRVFKDDEIKDDEIFWNVLDDKEPEIKVEIGCMRENTQNSAERYRWIPNTGEYLSLERISISAYNKIGIRLKGEDWKVILNGAIDRDWKEGNTEGNIYNNSDCKFDIKVGDYDAKLSKEQNERYAINWGVSNADTEKTSFIIEGSDNILKYADTNEVAEILIRPESAEKARPGDDLLLEFKISNGSIEKEVTVSPTDYIAVYDKKMLWRANLYINKPEAALGGEDWNNAHPWDASCNADTETQSPWWWDGDGTLTAAQRWGYNDWNKNEDDTQGEGKQISINSWTRWNDGKEVTNSVAYGWGCWDAVKQFNTELKNQRIAIGNYRNEHPESEFAALLWTNAQTTAPGTGTGTKRWKNYIFQKEAAKDKNGENKISEINEDVSVPGLSTYWDEKPRNSYKAGTHDKWTSGIDCSGLACICAQYSGRIYTISDWRESKNISTTNLAGRRFNETSQTYEEVSNPITYAIYDASKEGPWDIANTSENYNKQRKLLSHAVPGDILVKTSDHVVIIQNLNYPDDTMLITDFSQIDVIHSCKSLLDEDALWKVRKSTFNEVDSVTNISSYQLRRYSLRSE